jgi:hypothetical protein
LDQQKKWTAKERIEKLVASENEASNLPTGYEGRGKEADGSSCGVGLSTLPIEDKGFMDPG